MKIHPEFKSKCQELNLDYKIAFLVCCASYLGEEGLEIIQDKFIDSSEDESKYRIALLKTGVDGYIPKIPVFLTKEYEDDFNEFHKNLVKTLTSNNLSLSKINSGQDTRKAYMSFKYTVDNFTMQNLIAACIKYYTETGQYSLNLNSFLLEKAKTYYLDTLSTKTYSNLI